MALKHAHTKIVATIGPASEGRIGELFDAGLSVARLNFSHGEHEEHRRRAELIRSIAKERGIAVGILGDIQGPKLRLAHFEGGKLELSRGDTLRLCEGGGMAGPGEALFNFDGFHKAVSVGHRIFLADGVVELRVLRHGGDYLEAKVVNGGMIGDRKGVALPDSTLGVELPTPKDKDDLALARELGFEFIGASFVCDAADVRAVKRLAPDAQIVAKIERAAAVENIDEILRETDGIMIARGDLGVETALEDLPMLQKRLLRQASAAGRFAIVATEMLESMVEVPRPTRAEAADVANAVLDGTDAVMLSAETAVGAWPVEAVRTMGRIANSVEQSSVYQRRRKTPFREMEPDFSNAIARAAVLVSEALSIDTIVCFTESGNTARLLSRYRPNAVVHAFSPNERSLSSMSILAHVIPHEFPRANSLEEMLWEASRRLLDLEAASFGDEVVFVAGVPPGISRTTNVMKLHRVGEPVRLS